MTASDFTPENELEIALVATREGRSPLKAFLKLLIDSNVYVPSGAEVQSDGSGFQPLLFDRRVGSLMAVFTSLQRTSRFSEEAPYCLSMTGKALMDWMPSAFGLVVNPGFSVGFELPASGVIEIRRDFGTRR